MPKRRVRAVGVLSTLVLLALVSACTCAYSAEVVNDTDAPVFANLSYDMRGRRHEEEGVLISAHSRRELSRVGPSFLRVRDLSGETVAFQHLTENEDTRLVVGSLDPVPDPAPLGMPEGISGISGLSTKWSTRICRDGEEEKVPLTGVMVTIRSDYDGPLVASGFEPYPDRTAEEGINGVLVPPLGKAKLHMIFIEEPWVRAFDGQGELVFTQALPRYTTGLLTITIPSDLPSEPQPIPQTDFTWGTGFGTECGFDRTTAAITLGSVLAGVTAAAGTVWVWRRRLRRTRRELPR